MKHCQFCGSQMEDDANFCSKCGLEQGVKPVQEVEIEKMPEAAVDPNAAPPLPETSYYDSGTTGTSTEALQSNNGLVWLILSIILTVCCCPFSFLQIITIVFAAISMSRYNQGDYEEAKRYSKIAMIIFFSVLGLMIIGIVVSFAFTGAMFPWYGSDIFEQFDFT